MSISRCAAVPDRGLRRTAPRVALRDVAALTWVPIGAMCSLLVVSVAMPGTASAIALPVALVGALVGVPHGAVDHLVPGWLATNRRSSEGLWPGRLRLVRFIALYAGATVAAAAALITLPTPTLLAFLLVSAAHFGWGEVVSSAERSDRPAHLEPGSLLLAAAYGLATVGLLVWRNPAVTDPYLRALSPAVADGILATATAGVLVSLVTVTAALILLLATRRRLEAGELLLLTATFLLAPPLAAFGVYFGLWHAVRYSGRLLDLLRSDDTRRARVDRGWGPSCTQLVRLSSLPTAAAVAAVVAVAAFHDVTSLQAEVSVLLAVTFPHAAVVARLDMDRSRRAGLARPVVNAGAQTAQTASTPISQDGSSPRGRPIAHSPRR